MKILLGIAHLALMIMGAIIMWDINFWWSLCSIIYLVALLSYIIGETATERKDGK